MASTWSPARAPRADPPRRRPDRSCRGRPTGQSMVAEDRAPRCVYDRRTGASRAAVLVRAGSAQHREPLVIDGHEQSRRHARIAGRTAFTTTTSTAKQHGTGFEFHLTAAASASTNEADVSFNEPR